ncbi:MAG: hypothetical protein Q7S33_02195 [Nanoarchaeota archaeon]|nr:hypothetical protein [Nanoarchaeota archaeon]
MIAFIGLTLIIIGWIIQFLLMGKKKKIYASFIIIYSLGVAFLVYDGFISGLNSLAIANLISLAVSLIVLIKLKFY